MPAIILDGSRLLPGRGSVVPAAADRGTHRAVGPEADHRRHEADDEGVVAVVAALGDDLRGVRLQKVAMRLLVNHTSPRRR